MDQNHVIFYVQRTVDFSSYNTAIQGRFYSLYHAKLRAALRFYISLLDHAFI